MKITIASLLIAASSFSSPVTEISDDLSDINASCSNIEIVSFRGSGETLDDNALLTGEHIIRNQATKYSSFGSNKNVSLSYQDNIRLKGTTDDNLLAFQFDQMLTTLDDLQFWDSNNAYQGKLRIHEINKNEYYQFDKQTADSNGLYVRTGVRNNGS